MTVPNGTKQAAVIRLLRKGLVTHDEAADLASTSRELVQHWALREGIDIATTRATYLLKIWRSELVEEQAKWWLTAQELNTEQMKLDRAWEKHLQGKVEERG
jgi:hypothetical protein